MDKPPLKHEVALLGKREVRAPDLQSRCESDLAHPDAARITAASRAGLLSCAVCRTRVKKVFGSSKRWHFALFPGAVYCDHENETVAHRETKLALFEALKENLPPGWSVFVEKNLPNGRRPDVLATHEGGARVAFEVQYADLPEVTWRERREAYRVAGIKDYWLLGHSRRELARDTPWRTSSPGRKGRG